MNRSTIICWALVLPIAAGIGAKPLNAQFKMDEEQKKLMENQQLLQHLQFIAQNPMIQKELEIVPDQLGTLGTLMKDYQSYQQKIMMEYQKEIADARSAIAEGDQKKAMEIGRGLQKKMNERTSEIIGELEETLLPHQLRRLRQLARQQSLKYQSGYNDEFGVPYALADELELTKKQKEKLKQTIEDARKRLPEKTRATQKVHAQAYHGSVAARKARSLSRIARRTV